MRLVRTVALTTTLATVALAAPAGAAGTLTEYLGARPDGSPVPAGPWSGLNAGSLTGGAFGARVPAGVGVGWSISASLSPPPGLSFAAATADRTFSIPAGWDTAQAQAVTTWESEGWPYTGVSPLGGYYGVSGSGWVMAFGPPSLSIDMSCVTFGAGGGTCVESSWLINRIELAIADAVPPAANLVAGGGELLAAGWRTGASAALELHAGDAGSGVYRAFLREGSTTRYVSLDPADARCRDARPGSGSDYEFAASTASLVPCPTVARDYAPAFGLSALGDGLHTVDLGVEDASGREAIVAAGRVVRINAPGGTLADPGTPCPNGAHDDSGTCIARPPSSTSPPQLSGSPAEDLTLATDTGAWNDIAGVTWSYGWEACEADGSGCAPIGGAAGASLRLDAGLVGRRIRAVVSATTNGGTTTARSSLSPVIYPRSAGGTGGAGTIRDVEPGPSTEGRGGGGGGGALHRVEVIDRLDLPVPATRTGALADAPNGDGDDGGSPRLRARLTNGERASASADGRATSAASSIAGRLPYGITPVIEGRLTTATGAPIAGAQIDVISHRTTAGAAGRIDGAAHTDRDGRFTYRADVGVSRVLTFGYRRTLADRVYAGVAQVTVRVVPSVTLAVDRTPLRNGDTVTFRGTVVGAPPGARKLVELEVRSGGRWTVFATARMRAGGYVHRYRFTRTTRTTTYRFRARVSRDATWPLETATSATRAVEVRR
jgi:hypothetical protein